MSRLAGKTCIVTGAARGIGRAICEAFAQEGGRVYGLDRLNGEADSAVIFTIAWLVPAALLPATAIGLVGTYVFVRARKHD